MTERQLRSWKANKTKLVKDLGFNNITAARAALGKPSDEETYITLLEQYNQNVKARNIAIKKEIATKRKQYNKDKRESMGTYNREDFKLLPNNSKIASRPFKEGDKSDLEKYTTQSVKYIMEVRVFYDCELKADDWTEDDKKWQAPFRTSRAQVVVEDTIAKLKKKALYTANGIIYQLQNISPEQNTNFVVKYSEPISSDRRTPITKIKMRRSSPLKLNGEPLPHFDMGTGLCVYDALKYLWSQPNSNMTKKANNDYLNSVFITEENPTPEEDGVDIDTLLELAQKEDFSLYAFDIHDRIITKYTNDQSRRSNKPPLIFRIYNEHMYMICDKRIQASLIAKNRNGEHIRHINVENDKAKFVKTDTTVYENVIPTKTEVEDKPANQIIYDYIFDNNAVPFPFTNKTIAFDKGHINSMIIGNKRIYTKPIECDIQDYITKQGIEYTGQNYVSILMEKWEEHFGFKLSENPLISHMNPKVCDLMNDENVKNRVHLGAMMHLDNVLRKPIIDNDTEDVVHIKNKVITPPISYTSSQNWLSMEADRRKKEEEDKQKQIKPAVIKAEPKVEYDTIENKIDNGEIVGADKIKCYSSILDNPMDNWLQYEITDEIEPYNGKLTTGLYFVLTDDLTILHKTNWYSNTIIRYALDEGIELKIIRQYVPKKKQEKNKHYFKKFIDYISANCSVKLTKNILNSLTGMLGKTKQSSYNMSITSDLNEVWAELIDNIDRVADFQYNSIGKDEDKKLYVYGFKNKKNIYTNNLPMYIQILDQSNIKLHQLAKDLGGQMLYRKTDAVIVYLGKNIVEFDKNKRENWGKNTIMDKDELKKYNYAKMANQDRCVENKFNTDDEWKTPTTNTLDTDNKTLLIKPIFTTSNQYKEIIQYATNAGGLLICSRAGTGKSYIINKGIEDGLIEDDKRIRLAFTNKAARNINGITIHSAISLNSETHKASMKMIQTYKNKKLIIVDEISMLNEELWTQLVNLKRVSGATFILMGDFRQLPSVEQKEHNYFDSAIVKYLTNNNTIELTERQRYDEELWDWLENFYERGLVGNNLQFTKKINYDAYNISFFNKTRIEVNKMFMEHHKPADALFIPHVKKQIDDRACSIYIYAGLPVMSVVNKTTKQKKGTEEVNQTQLCNSDTMTVVSYNETHITMKLDVPDEEDNDIVIVAIDEFHKSFVCNYCSTTHKNQGATITKNIQLWDWNKMITDRRIAYTAVSRARSISQLKIVA